MKKNYKYVMFLILINGLLFSLSLDGIAQDKIPTAQLPVLTTSAGQSSDVNTINVILEQAGVGYDYCDVPTAKMVETGVGLGGKKSGEGFHVEVYTDLEKFKKGTAYKTIIFAIGASLKGMGASGLTVEDELKRLKEVVDYCKKNKIFIIGVHAGGEATRGASGSNNEKMIDAIAPFADYLITLKDSNKDGRFTKISKDKGIPFTEVQYALGIVKIMKDVFK